MLAKLNVLQYNSSPATLTYKSTPATQQNTSKYPYIPEPQFSSGIGRFDINQVDSKIQIDNYTATSTLGYGNLNYLDFNKKCKENHLQMQNKFVSRVNADGAALNRGSNPADIVLQNKLSEARNAFQSRTAFLPSSAPDISFTKSDIDINYTPTKTTTGFTNVDAAPLKTTPGKINFNYTPYSLTFTYTGGYV